MDLSSLVVSGVYVIENGGHAYVGYSKNVLKAFAGHIEDIKKGRHKFFKLPDLDSCNFKLLEVVQGTKTLKLKYGAWCEHYRNSEYTLYRNYIPLEYKVKTNIKYIGLKPFIVVSLVNKRNENFTVGVFGKVEYAEEFIQKYYGKTPIAEVVYSGNSLTRKYKSKL